MILRPWKHIKAMNEMLSLRREGGSGLFGVSHDGARDLNTIYGYNTNPQFRDYWNVFRFQDVASAVVKKPAKSCWRDVPKIKQGEDVILEDVLTMLVRLNAFNALERADVLNRIGRYSVLFVGIPDGLAPDQPLGTSNEKNLEKIYFTPYAEDGIVITEWDKDEASERFGLPLMYTLQVMDRGEKDTTVQTLSRRVHFSRVVHLAEGALDSEVEGLSSLSAILNRLVDLNKTIGGASEAYFKNACGKYAFETDSDFTGTISNEDKASFVTAISDWVNNFQNTLRLTGISAKVLNTPHADPSGSVKVAMEAISGETGIPMRILTGQGAGKLAGNEDKASYNELVNDRQDLVCTGWLLRLLRILSDAKLIPEVPFDAVVEWPVTEAMNSLEQAKVRQINADAFAKVSSGLGDMSGLADEVQPQQAIEEILGFEYMPLLNEGIEEPPPEPEPEPEQ